MRHALANMLYRLGHWLDRPARRDEPNYGEFGEEPKEPARGVTTASFSMHMRRDVPIAGSFSQTYGSTYSALHIGRGHALTIFLERESTLRLQTILSEMARRFERYGETGWHS